ncbi:lanthionine synthetase LanC family protein [uncultured Pedobacter sp.]|uniref:lanthionine synthetase LanC family protein n=1 Tax=uncultured Pedobacter sp. TaxID=246139 RepID=UPI0025CFAE79|nr:lanthionine synthetase LanC family protein [uncultured Pedobacter sp.]
MQHNISSHIENIKLALANQTGSIKNVSYETGLLGLSLFYCYYAKYTGEEEYLNHANECFSQALASLDLGNFKRVYQTDSLDCHLSHLGRFIGFCQTYKLLELDAEDYLLKIDQILSDLMASKIAMGNFDLNSGALAAGYYFLSRPPIETVNQQLSILIRAIAAKAKTDADGDYYWDVPTLANKVYLGISHGSALIISFVSNAYERGIEPGRCQEIILRASNFLLKQKMRYKKGLFPNYIGDSEPDFKQFSLCYGDLGIGYALYRSAVLLDNRQLMGSAKEILEDCLTRKKEDGLTFDASLTYGAAGLAETFDKLYRLCGDKRFKAAADYWYQKIPDYAVNENKFAGYRTKLVGAGDLWNVSFGWGIIGIGISLMRSIDERLPPIDALLSVA